MQTTKSTLLQKFGHNRKLRAQVCNQRERLYRIAWSWCHDQHLADDLVQETQAKALEKLDSLREESRLAVWLTRIMANIYRDHFRKNREETGLEIDVAIEDETPELSTDRMQLVQRTRDAIASLSDDQRQIISLVDLASFSYADTAKILDIPVGTVMSRLSRARNKLRERLERPIYHTKQKVVPIRKPS